MKKILFSLIILITVCSASLAQPTRPKLVVGIVVDQMRPDYLTRFYNDFGDGGFKKLMAEGYTLWNVHYNYVPTYTGPGHASIYSGTTPRFHGIIGNDIYDRQTKKSSYCVKDTFDIIGNAKTESGKGMSANRLIASNICDELKLCTNKKSKVFSISMKDRAAILSGGHLADYALWFDQSTGNFVTTTCYAGTLPPWVISFNDRHLASGYTTDNWNPLYGDDRYTDCVVDTTLCAITKTGGKILPRFPHALKQPAGATQPTYSPLYNSPFGNALLTDLAIETLQHAELGKGLDPDFLAISYSSPDGVGHLFGPHSKEMKDTYLRLDKDLERLINTLDQSVGKNNYVLFLTADHGVADNPNYLMNQKIPAGYVYSSALVKSASEFLSTRFSAGKWIDKFTNDQFYLNRELIREKGFDLKTMQDQLAEFLIGQKGIAFAYTATAMNETEFTSGIALCVQNGFQPKHSGDVMMVMEPGYFEYGAGSVADHGSAYHYDTHVPLIWYGDNIRKGESWQLHYITDVAPTLSMILRIKYPSACVGNPIVEISTK